MLGTHPLIAENAVYIPEMLIANGGVFGPDFDPDNISFSSNGSVEIIFDSADLVC